MNLYLLRHGEAEASASTSAGRKLTEAGHLEIVSVAMQFASRRLEMDACFVSPALRAKQTAETFLSHIFNAPEPSIIDELSANQRASNLMHFLGHINANNVLLVSHNPILSELLALLTKGNVDNLVILDTGDLACVSLEVIGLGMGTCPFILQASASIPAS